MPPCMGMGQAAGTAAALAIKTDKTVRDCDVKLLQKTLVDNGCVLD